eukprot:443680-Pelagomonas_calceolata.AAC.4
MNTKGQDLFKHTFSPFQLSSSGHPSIQSRLPSNHQLCPMHILPCPLPASISILHYCHPLHAPTAIGSSLTAFFPTAFSLADAAAHAALAACVAAQAGLTFAGLP